MEEQEDDVFDELLNDAGMLTPEDNDSADLYGVSSDDYQPSETPIDSGIPMPNIEDLDNHSSEEEEEEEEPTKQESNSLIEQLLAAKGIEGSTIKYEGDDGEIEEVDFYSLSAEEQLAILKSDDSDHNWGLDDNEIGAVNFLRENGVTLEEAVDYYKKQAIQEYIDSQNIVGIEIDQYTDEDLFAIDFKAKYPDFSDEEIKIELEKQLEHPDLFKKKVDKLRTDYKKIEEEQLEAVRLQEEEEQEQKVVELRNSLITVAEGIEDIGGLDLDNNDKNEVLAFILEKDINGISPFIKSLDSPKQLFELAWYATKGKEAFNIVHDYYKREIDKVNKAAYAKGKADATKKPVTPSKPQGKTYVRNSAPRAGQAHNKEHYPDLDDMLNSQLND